MFKGYDFCFINLINFIMNSVKSLLRPFVSNHLQLNNRFVMAPLTRQRANADLALTELNALYYAQRATAGLIVSEASQITPKGQGYPNTPGIYSEKQIEGWKLVTEAVHQNGGKIFCQLWHVGRHSHPFIQIDGGLPHAPSAIAEPGLITTLRGKVETVVPHAMTINEIKTTVEAYAQAASNAIKAGFDGVEIHAANGYLIDQFLNDASNTRTDAYGGSIDNKIRFAIEVVEAVIQAVGNAKTALRISPSGTNFGLRNQQPVETFEALVHQLNAYDLAYVHLIEPDPKSLLNMPQYLLKVTPHFRPLIQTTLITSAGYDFSGGEEAVESGLADLVAFGKMFISNPDFVERYATDAPLNAFNMATFYGGGAEGYTDYPFLNQP